jgi:hypothetical protein
MRLVYTAENLINKKMRELLPANMHVRHGCKEGVPMDFAVFTILAGFGASFGILYRSLTLTTGARKNRETPFFQFGKIADVFWSGKCLITGE